MGIAKAKELMSHFAVLVITSEKPTKVNQLLEKALQPFHEFECTGVNDEFIQEVDETSDVLARIEKGESLDKALCYHDFEDSIVSDESELDREGAHKYRYAIVNGGKLVKAVRRTNPNAKWDWWIVGGRWCGFFTPKQEAEFTTGRPSLLGLASGQEADQEKADTIRKGDIDFEFMRKEAGENAGKRWNEVRETIGDLAGYVSWQEVRENMFPGNIEAARDFYNNQPQAKAFRESKKFGIFDGIDNYTTSREEFVSNARNDALTTFAVLKDGQWVERGNMGWWGIVSNEKDGSAWDAEFNKMLDQLPDECWLSIVDCHI